MFRSALDSSRVIRREGILSCHYARVYTAQGFEFDYIGVIFGNDLVYSGQGWHSVPENSSDTQVKRNNPGLTKHLQHVYRVLLSRAHRGVYVYFMDKSTERHFRDSLPELQAAAATSP